MDHMDCIVVGAGAVGLAIAKVLAEKGRKVLVLEQSGRFGEGVSSRNSEVIHAGIYYEPGSLKERLCIDGKQRLYDYCRLRHVPFNRIGKLIVATAESEVSALEIISAKVKANDVPVQWLDKDQLLREEPAVRGVCALFSPSTGILDSHAFMLALVADIEAHKGQIAYQCRVDSVSQSNKRFEIETETQGERYPLSCNTFVNAAGLGAQRVSHQAAFLQSPVPTLYFCAGRYFHYQAKNPFHHLVYPVPDKQKTGLGVHATHDMAGQLKFGPDAVYIDDERYAVINEPPPDYIEAIRKYFPLLDETRLVPGYTGIRPRLSAPNSVAKDFCIEGPNEHGIENFVQLFGIESPGLTSSLAIGHYVAEILD